MNEATVRAQFAKGLRKYCHVVSIENAAGVGTPDLNVCIDGQEMWIEVKYFSEWPKRASTPINIGGKNKASWARECAWMTQRIAAGGVCYVYVRIGRDNIILDANELMFNGGILRRVEDGRLDSDFVVAQWTVRNPNWEAIVNYLHDDAKERLTNES